MQYIPAPPQSPIATGLQQLMQGMMQGRAVDRQKKMQDSDRLKAMFYQKQMQDFNALSPEQQLIGSSIGNAPYGLQQNKPP